MHSGPTSIGKKRNIADVSGVEFRLQQERTNAENIDYRFNRAAHDRSVCAGHREVRSPGFLGSRPGTEDAEERDGGGTGQDAEEQDGGGAGQIQKNTAKGPGHSESAPGQQTTGSAATKKKY